MVGQRVVLALGVGALLVLVLGCAEESASRPTAGGTQPLARLDLQVRNSGLIDGGYLWLGITGGGGRWHRFGQAEYLCITCPLPFTGAGPSYEIAVFDDACHLRGRVNTPGGNLEVAIELGPRVVLVPAPPITDWIPSDSAPLDAADVPCAPL